MGCSCDPHRLIIGLRVHSFGDESALGLGKNIGSAHAEHLGDGQDVIYTDGPFSGKYARNLRLRHAAAACNLSPAEAPAISKFTQNTRH